MRILALLFPMKRTKVKIRSYPISQGRRSLQLDYYPPIRNPETNKLVRMETLGMYIFDKPQTAFQREHNTATLAQAEAIRGMRQQSVINEEFGFLDKTKLKADFLAFFWKFAQENGNTWESAFRHFERFMSGRCTFGELTLDLCLKYRQYIQKATKFRQPDRRIHINTAAGYFKYFKYVVYFAYRDKWIKENIADFLDYIEVKPTRRDFLTPTELMNLSRTPCEIPVLKRASLFSCLTGLRYSDVLSLKWSNIVSGLSGGGYCMQIQTEKTDAIATLPLSDDAVRLMGPRGEGPVFAGLNRNMLLGPLERWVAAAGSTKHITFHCFRHTYAVLQLAGGTDIYTVSRMLTHKHVSTTEVYLALLEESKIETTGKIRIYIEPPSTAACRDESRPNPENTINDNDYGRRTETGTYLQRHSPCVAGDVDRTQRTPRVGFHAPAAPT